MPDKADQAAIKENTVAEEPRPKRQEEPGSYALFHVEEREKTSVLLVLNADRVADDGTPIPAGWSLPGGGMENGETPYDTVVRESCEECQLPMELFTELFPFPADGSVANVTRSGREQYLHVRKISSKALGDLRAPDNPEVIGLSLVPLYVLQMPRRPIKWRHNGIEYPIRRSTIELVNKFFSKRENTESKASSEDEGDEERRGGRKSRDGEASIRQRGWTSRSEAAAHRRRRANGWRLRRKRRNRQLRAQKIEALRLKKKQREWQKKIQEKQMAHQA